MNVANLLQILAETSHSTETVAKTAEHAEAGGIALLGIDPLAILLQAVTFIILFVLLRKFGLSKIVKTLDDRHQTIEESLENAKMIEKTVAETSQKQQEMLTEARKEADSIIGAAHNESKKMLKEAEAKTAETTDRMIKEAHSKIESDVKSARSSLAKEAKILVAEATEAILHEKIDSTKDNQLIERAIAEAQND
jgi:F-type H+-transporting ATPase subunit b